MLYIVIVTFNAEPWLHKCLSGLSKLDYPAKVIVVDNASTDGTLDIIDEFKSSSSLPVKLHHHKPKGIGANWNNCMHHASGKYIKFLFQDDVLEPNCILEMVELLESNERVALVSCKRDFIVEHDSISAETDAWLRKYSNLPVNPDNNDAKIIIWDKSIMKADEFFAYPLNKIG